MMPSQPPARRLSDDLGERLVMWSQSSVEELRLPPRRSVSRGRAFHRSNREGSCRGNPRKSVIRWYSCRGRPKKSSLSTTRMRSTDPVDQPMQLLRILTTAAIRVVAVAEAVIAGISKHSLELGLDACVLQLQCPLERLRLEARANSCR